MIISTTVGAATHRDDPSWVGHLIVDLSQRRCHLICESSCHNHDVRLSGGGTENDTETILIVPRGRQVHHFDGAACKAEGHGPEGALTRPVGYLVERCPVTACQPEAISTVASSLPKQDVRGFHLDLTYSAYCMAPFFPSWLGNGTSRRACFIGGGVPGLPGMMAGDFIVAALSDEVEERKAALPARKGSSAVAGLAVQNVSRGRARFCSGGDQPRRAIEAADLVVDSILATNTKEKRPGKEWRRYAARWRW